jgi:predicted extracellular nuclease
MPTSALRPAAVAAALLLAGAAAHAQLSGVKITEWMYSGDEFVEFTNLGPAAVDFTGWSYDDDSRVPFTVDLSAFGLVAPGESVILAERSAEAFRTEWSLSGSVKVIGDLTVNLGRSDEINLYDGSGMLVDRLTYGDNSIGGPRTQNFSGIPGSEAVIGANTVAGWVLSAVGDGQGSYASLTGFVASPGFTPFAAVIPEPGTWALMLGGLGVIGTLARRRRG